MKTKILSCLAIALLFIAASAPSHADELDQGRQMMASGDLHGAAEFFNRYAVSHPDDSKKTPEALATCGRILDALADSLTGAAEKKCYWSKGGGGAPECMQREAAALNAKFGSGAFRYEHAITFILYTGSHYRTILDRFSKSDYAPEAEFYLLLRDLIGHPDTVLPKIKAFLAKNSRGDWNRRGLLLWARANEDIWFVHRKWSWVLYNYQISPDELIIKAEPYRQEALKTYEKLMKDKGTFEGAAAAREYALLKASKDDDITYSIVNDSSPGTLSTWGIAAPKPPAMPPERSGRPLGEKPLPAAPASGYAPAPAPAPVPAPENKKTAPSVPSRWQ